MYQREMRTKIPSAKEVLRELDNGSDLLDRDRAVKERAAGARKRKVQAGDILLIKSMTPATKWSPKYLQALGTVIDAERDSCLVEAPITCWW